MARKRSHKKLRVQNRKPDRNIRKKPVNNKQNKQSLSNLHSREHEGLFHKIWFSKKPDDHQTGTFQFQHDSANNNTGKEPKIRSQDLEKSLSLMKDMLDEMKKQNEEIRKDREIFLDKLNEMVGKSNSIMKQPEMKKDALQAKPSSEQRILGSTIVESYANENEPAQEKQNPAGQKKGKIFKIKNEKQNEDRIIIKDAQKANENKQETQHDNPKQADTKDKIAEPSDKRKDSMDQVRSENNEKITTSLDSLLDLIAQTNTIKVPDAARRLHVKDRQIEEWAHVLEEHGLIDVHYPTFGKPILKKKTAGAPNAR